jgi:hypothetical protein
MTSAERSNRGIIRRAIDLSTAALRSCDAKDDRRHVFASIAERCEHTLKRADNLREMGNEEGCKLMIAREAALHFFYVKSGKDMAV